MPLYFFFLWLPTTYMTWAAACVWGGRETRVWGERDVWGRKRQEEREAGDQERRREMDVKSEIGCDSLGFGVTNM
jgi:hypothetical protein